MNTGIEQFYEVFFEEAAELLAQMESLLVTIDCASPSIDDLNAIFRVAHSIKGGAGTFGFSDMIELTHVLESFLDKLRRSELALKPEMVDVLLEAGDVLKRQLAGHRGAPEPDTPAAAQAICASLKHLSERRDMPHVAAVAADTRTPDVVAAGTTYMIRFSGAGTPARAVEALLGDLESRGTLERVQVPEVVSDERSTTAGCDYVLRLTTNAPEEDLWEALAFVVAPENIQIIAEGPALAAAHDDRAREPEARVEEDLGYGLFHETEPSNRAGTEAQNENRNASPGRRTTDQPDVAPSKGGRREGDKTVGATAETTSIRVSVEKVDQMINLVGELVITQAMLAQTASQVDPVLYEKLLNGMSHLERNTRDLQEAVMSIRMVPISFVFSRFPRVVRDLAAKLDKQVDLKTIGEGTELDRGLIEKVVDPLTHLVRNSLDHGIERPEERLAAGKPARGTITLRASHQGGSIIVEVSDDGAGLDRERILAKARERGFAVHDGLTDQEVWQFIFDAGFSTAASVTDVSGRGVGMDVVRRNIQSLGGRVDIESTKGQGTCITIRLPLTLAILDGMSISVGDEIFIIPLTYIVECLRPRAEDVKTVGGQGLVVQVRGDYLPVLPLHSVFNISSNCAAVEQGIMVIMEAASGKTALLVDALLGQHQVVIKNLESNYRKVRGISGATIMGDGKVALILDVEMLVDMTKTMASCALEAA